MLKGLGPLELIIILLIVLVIFGGSKLPQLGRSLGQGIKEFRRGLKGGEEEKATTSQLPPAQGKNGGAATPQH